MADDRPLPALRPPAPVAVPVRPPRAMRAALPLSVGLAPLRPPAVPALVRGPRAPAVPPGRPLPAPLPRRPLPAPAPRPAPPARRPAPTRPEREPAFAEEPAAERPFGRVEAPQDASAYRQVKCDCPTCGRLVDPAWIEGGPYDMALYTVDVGGRVRRGKVHVYPSGRVVDHSRNTRGSIATHGYWDRAFAEALEDVAADSLERSAALARRRDLAALGTERES